MSDSGSGEYRHRIFIERLLIAVAVVVTLAFLWSMVGVLILVFAAVVVAVVLRMIADPIARWLPIGDTGAVALAVLLVVAVIAGFGFLLGSRLNDEFSDLTKALPVALQDFERRLTLFPLGNRMMAAIGEYDFSGTNVVGRLGGLVMSLGTAIADFLLIVFGAIFIAAHPELYKRGLLKLIPKRGRDNVGEALDDSGRALRRWLYGQLVAMVLIGVLTWLGLWMIGLPSAVALGLIAGAAEIVPYVGPVVSAIPGLLLALLQGPEMVLWTLFVYVAVQQVEGALIMPIVQQKAVALPPALTLFGVIGAGLLFGFVGLIFAAPLLVVAYVLIKKLYVRDALDTETPIPGAPADPQPPTGEVS